MKKLTHVALIMDGNGRWAKQRMLPVSIGHNKGMEQVETTIRYAKKVGIQYLTFYAFSTENWKRSVEEVNHLLSLIKKFYRSKRHLFLENRIRFNFIGSRTGVPEDILEIFDKFMDETKAFDELVVNIAFNYGAHQEIVEAINFMLADGVSHVDEQTVESYLYTHDQPPVDLLIRTSGEMRVSNFLLWQIAYSEFVFLDCYWPEFDEQEFAHAIEIYHQRERRFGGR